MNFKRFLLILVLPLALMGLTTQNAIGEDTLYIGDGFDNTIKSFDADSGSLLGQSEGPTDSGLAGPRGIVLSEGELLVVNQNVNLPIRGEVLKYDAATGVFLGRLIAATDKEAPFSPDGLVLGQNQDLLIGNVTTANGTSHGELRRYDSSDGTFLSAARAQGFKNKDLHVRGVVVGPDGLVYVSVRSLKKDGLGGAVLRYNADGSFFDVFVNDEGGGGQLNRPDGLVFGPDDGRLYVTSFRAAPGDTDSIRIYDAGGVFQGKIDLHNGTTEPRVFAQSLLFGPGGKLFVPVSTSPNPAISKGQLRCYNNTPATGVYDVLVTAESGALLAPVYMTFGKTNPSTLNYEE